MSIDALLIILLVWTVAGLLAAIAFGKVIRETSPDDEENLAAPAGSVKYLRKTKDKSRDASDNDTRARHHGNKRASG
ncbi:MAG: hypothetical protein AB1560_05580 [Pseudomonadota bacterium]